MKPRRASSSNQVIVNPKSNRTRARVRIGRTVLTLMLVSLVSGIGFTLTGGEGAAVALAAVGAKLKDYYFALGDADVFVTYEAPDAATAASVAMTVGASGALSSAVTIALLTTDEAMEAMKTAQSDKYAAPTRRIRSPI